MTLENPFEKVLSPNCLDREASYNRGCYSGFERARKVYEPTIKELNSQWKKVVDNLNKQLAKEIKE